MYKQLKLSVVVNRYMDMSNLIGKMYGVDLGRKYNFIFPVGKNIQSSDVIIILDVMGEMVDPDKYDELCKKFDKKYIIDKNGDVINR